MVKESSPKDVIAALYAQRAGMDVLGRLFRKLCTDGSSYCNYLTRGGPAGGLSLGSGRCHTPDATIALLPPACCCTIRCGDAV